jgi:hypothetical protein
LVHWVLHTVAMLLLFHPAVLHEDFQEVLPPVASYSCINHVPSSVTVPKAMHIDTTIEAMRSNIGIRFLGINARLVRFVRNMKYEERNFSLVLLVLCTRTKFSLMQVDWFCDVKQKLLKCPLCPSRADPSHHHE